MANDSSEWTLETNNLSSAVTEVSYPPDWALTFTALAAIAIAIIGFLGNSLTMVALPFSHKLRNPATWFVVNLAATECLFCVVILPLVATHLFYLRDKQEPLFSDASCKPFVFLRYVNVQAELLSIAGVALNRCILIVTPYRYKKIFSNRNTALSIVSIWAISIVIMLFPLFDIYGHFAYNPLTHECDFADDTEAGQGPRRVFLALGFILPALIIILSYIFIFYKARQSLQRFKNVPPPTVVPVSPRRQSSNLGYSSARERPAAGLRSRDIRIAVTILVIFITFMVCCLPVSIMHYIDDKGVYKTTLLLLHPLYWLQYCLNIFIYVFMNNQYRDAYINFIANWWPRFKNLTRESFHWPEEEPSTESRRHSRAAQHSVARLAALNDKQ